MKKKNKLNEEDKRWLSFFGGFICGLVLFWLVSVFVRTIFFNYTEQFILFLKCMGCL